MGSPGDNARQTHSRECAIIGGRGFLGKLLTRRLLEAQGGGDTWDAVHVVDVAPTLTLDKEEASSPVMTQALEEKRLVYHRGDVTSLEDCKRVCRSKYAVFLMAAPSPELDNFKVHYSVSVIGAKNVVSACESEGVSVLVYTSSASVVFDGSQDLKGVDETWPTASKHMSVYGETKAQAEALILAANGRRGGLRTCSLRPSNIFGPGDVVLTPALARNASKGKLKFCIGDGTTQADWTYVENVAHAHLCAERALRGDQHRGTWEASGKAYFITNNDPKPIWGFLTSLAQELGYPVKVVAKIPASVILPLSYLSERVFKTLKPLGVKPSDFTPFRMKILTRWKVHSCARAQKLLQYQPQVSVEEGIRRTAAANPHLSAQVLLDKGEGKAPQ